MRVEKITSKITNAIILIIMITLFTGCGYIARQGVGLARYQFRSTPINRVLADTTITDEKRNFLETVTDIRNFAIDSIGLRRNNNYTRYVRVDRDYMVDVVVASRDDSFDLHRWWFPITGSVPYKGFFSRANAEREARKFERRRGNFDVHIGRADAFSTLGILSDPVYSFMSRYSVYDLASLIIHEQTHATIWVKGETQLNEEIATFVGDVGGLWYVRDRFGEDSEEYRAAILSKQDYRTYIDLIRNLYHELDTLYNSDESREHKLREKERIFADFGNFVDNNYDSLFATPRYRNLPQAKLNNAVIASRMTYNLDMDLFYELYDFLGGDLAAVVRELIGLRRVRRDHKDYIKSIIDSQ